MTSVSGLALLARAYGVQTSYYDGEKRRHNAASEALLAVLEALGAPVRSASDVRDAIRDRRLTLWRRIMPAVIVVWEGTAGTVELRLPVRGRPSVVRATLRLEDGRSLPLRWDMEALPPAVEEELEGERFALHLAMLPKDLPAGYHRLLLEKPAIEGPGALVIVAPRLCVPGPRYGWGTFLPLHALRSAYDWGVGDYSGLADLARWSATLGASVTGTLPLLPTFLDDPVEPSPYAAVTRLAWNPLFVDVLRAPRASETGEGERLQASTETHEEIERLRALPEVDYRRVMALKRRAMEVLAEANAKALEAFAAEHPMLHAYAQFMAARERLGSSWRRWPERQRRGQLTGEDYDRASWRYHLYGQMASHLQMEALGSTRGGADLYLDYPVGVHSDGFDTWREQDLFVSGATVGAPPDAFFSRGQNWGFNPPHPERRGDYSYFIAALRHHMRHAALLRLDHVMGLHRLYWVPQGADSTNGAYVRYPAEEAYAILALESHRHNTAVVGEDLGTVPPEVPDAMRRHGLKRMYVLQFSIVPGRDRPVAWPSRDTVASVNTHDTPTFAGYWRGLDIHDRHDLGLMDDQRLKAEEADRARARQLLVESLRDRGRLAPSQQDEKAVMEGVYKELAASRASLLLVNLEDLWLETVPQNTPGTSSERPNWRRKARYSIEEVMNMASIRELLTEVAHLRRNANGR